MRVTADLGKCDGYANCVVAAPDVFDLDDRGLVVILVDTPSDEAAAEVEEAVSSCPVAALRIESS